MDLIKTVAVIGAGSWGTAVAKDIAESKPHVTVRMWAFEKSVVSSINETGVNADFLPDIKLPPNITATGSMKEAVEGAQAVILAPPSKVLYDIARRLAPYIDAGMAVGFLTKGFCTIQDEVLTISQTIERAIPALAGRVVAISGPSHAEEVSRRYHTCLNVGGRCAETRSAMARLLDSEFVRCRETEDIRAVEVGGTLKNPAAIAAGMISALPRCGDNLAGALISEALREMVRLGGLFDISPDAMMDISGLGDLVATALSEHSRNRRFGRDIAAQIMKKGTTLNLWDRVVLWLRPENVIERMSEKFHYLAEGAYAIEPLIELAESKGVSIPVYRSLYEVLLNKKDPSLLVETIKSPDRFDELYFSTKIQIRGRKRGLEQIRGVAFRELIASGTADAFGSGDRGGASAHAPDDVMKLIKEQCGAPGSRSGPDEARLVRAMSGANYGETIRELAAIYAGEIVDTYSPLFKWLFFLFMGLVRLLNLFGRKGGRITVSGRLDEIRAAGANASVLYVAGTVSPFDSIITAFTIFRKGLPFPRFLISAEAATALNAFFLKMCGGFVVDTTRIANPIYREAVRQYLSIMAGHGVSLLYAIDRSTRKEEFFQAVTESVYRHGIELAIVPVELSYLARPGSPGIGIAGMSDVLANVVHLNFSKPLYVSEFTRMPHMIDGLPGIIAGIWEKERKIFPHYVLCKIIRDNGYSVKEDDVAGLVKRYLRRSARSHDYGPSKMARKGLRFLEQNGIIRVEDGMIRVADRETLNYYADLIS